MSLTNKAIFIIERNLTSALTLASIAENGETSRFHLATPSVSPQAFP
jgi:hypothetical protein